MKARVIDFAVIVAASVVATLLATYLSNNVTSIRRAVQ